MLGDGAVAVSEIELVGLHYEARPAHRPERAGESDGQSHDRRLDRSQRVFIHSSCKEQ